MPFIAPIAAAASSGSFLAAASAATSVAGTGLSFFGQRQQAQSVQLAADYNNQQAKNQARYEQTVAAENARRQQDYGRKVIGAQRAAMAASGMAPAGTPLVRLGETASAIQQEILDIGQAAALRSRSLLAQGQMGQWEASQQATAGRTASWGTLAGGLTSAGMGYLTASGKLPTSIR